MRKGCPMHSLFSTGGLAKASARHPWRIMGMWSILIACAAVAVMGLGGVLTTESTFLNTPESVKGSELLEARLRGKELTTETVIVRSRDTTVDDPRFQAVVERTTAHLLALQGVVSVGQQLLSERQSPSGLSRHARNTDPGHRWSARSPMPRSTPTNTSTRLSWSTGTATRSIRPATSPSTTPFTRSPRATCRRRRSSACRSRSSSWSSSSARWSRLVCRSSWRSSRSSSRSA